MSGAVWTWIAAAVAGAGGVPAIRLAARSPVRRLFPGVAAALGASATAWLAVVAALAVWQPAALGLAATVVASLGLVASWYARPSFGRSRRLPPGSLSPVRSIEAIADRDFYRCEAGRHGPIFKMAQFHQPVVCILGLERGHRLIREHEESLGPSRQPVADEIPRGFLRYMDRETHAVYGPLFRQALSAPVVSDAIPAMRNATDGALSPDRRAENGPRRIDPTPLLVRITDAAFLRTLFGIDPASPDFETFLRAARPLTALGLSDRMDMRARASLAELRAFAGRALESGSHSARSAIAELRRLDPRMPDETAIDNLVFIWKISASNAVGLLRWLLARLGENPTWLERVKSSADRQGDTDDLVDRVIAETLRLSQSEYLYRRVRTDLTFDGFTLPRGWLVRICVAESHRDASVFTDPDRFDPDRFLAHDYSRNAYSPFGTGRHACNGVPLVMALARVVLEGLNRWNWSVDGPGPYERDFRHWSHWRPSSGMRLVLEAPGRR